METEIGAWIKVKDPTDSVADYCRDNLVLPNPEYSQRERMGLWLGHTPKTLHLCYSEGTGLYIPYGCLQDLWPEIRKYPYTLDFAPYEPASLEGEANLFPYQEKAVEALLRGKNGILKAPCGSGKTQMGIELIRRIGGRALWLTHTRELVSQSMKRAKSLLKGDYATITEGKFAIGGSITFATVQTMARIDPSLYEDKFTTIIVDECHHCVGSPTAMKQFYKVVTSCNARYKYGLSATLERSDGLHKAMFACIGPLLHEIKQEEVGDRIAIARHEAVWNESEYDYEDYCGSDGVVDFGRLTNLLTRDADRNRLIAGNVIRCAQEGRKQLLLCSRVDHTEQLEDMLSGYGIGASVVTGETPKKKRDFSKPVIIATYSLAKEGLDIPDLDTLHLCSPQKDARTIVQAVGRIERAHEGKKEPIVYDYVDRNIPYCMGAYRKRKSIIRRKNDGD